MQPEFLYISGRISLQPAAFRKQNKINADYMNEGVQ